MPLRWRPDARGGRHTPWMPNSILPEVPEAIWRQLGVTYGVLDVLMPEVVLEGARIDALIRELEPGGMAKHMRMDRERHLGSLAEATDHPAKADRAHGRAALAHEYVAARLLLAL